MVLSSSNPTMEVAWLAWRHGKACVKSHKVSTQTRAHLESSFKRGARYNPFANPLPGAVSRGCPRIPLALALDIVENTQDILLHLATALTESLSSKDNPASLAIWHPTRALRWPLFLCTQSAVFTEGSVARGPTQARASVS